MKEHLMVLQEQHFMVERMIEDANRGRRFDTLEPLQSSRDELYIEIQILQREIEDLD